MKISNILSFVLILTSFGCKPTPTAKNETKRVVHHDYYKQKNNSEDSACSHLSSQEQEFAKKLSDFHKQIFCKQFSSFQRREAIILEGKMSGTPASESISADDAVEKIIKNSRNTIDVI